MENLESNIQAILERNKRVEADKAWETSITRRSFIALITYIAALTFLHFNGLQNPEIQALIPTGAYVLSTLSLPPLKQWWLKHHS
ncbi:MAG: hypothetical protein WCX61_00270 [Candidatus Peribacteraceae bacterium]